MNPKTKNLLIAIISIIVLTSLVLIFVNNKLQEDQLIKKTGQLINQDIDIDSIEIKALPFSSDQLLIVDQIKTSQELIDFVNSNISINDQIDILTQQPSELLDTKEGSKSDVAAFISKILKKQGLYSSTILYSYTDNNQEQIDIIIPFRDIDESKYIYFEDNKAHMTHHGWSYTEMFEAEEEKKSISIESHCILRQKTGYMEIAECSPQDEVIRKYHFITEE